jgi:hypothetical protein
MIVFTYYLTTIYSLLRDPVPWLTCLIRKTANHNQANYEENTMENTRTEDYFKDDTEGHVDTRAQNHECEKPDPHLGCDLGIDVAG